MILVAAAPWLAWAVGVASIIIGFIIMMGPMPEEKEAARYHYQSKHAKVDTPKGTRERAEWHYRKVPSTSVT